MIRPDVSMGEQGVLLVGVKEGEVLHDDGHQQVQHDVRDDQVERTEEQQSSWKRDLISNKENLPIGVNQLTTKKRKKIKRNRETEKYTNIMTIRKTYNE